MYMYTCVYIYTYIYTYIYIYIQLYSVVSPDKSFHGSPSHRRPHPRVRGNQGPPPTFASAARGIARRIYKDLGDHRFFSVVLVY